MSTLTIAWRYLMGRKLRTFLTTLAIVFGVFVIFGMNVLIPTMIEAFMSNVMAATGHVDMTVTLKTGEAFSPDVLETLRAVDGVKVAAGYLKRTLNLPADYFDHDPNKLDQVGTLVLVGMPASSDEIHSTHVVEGRYLGQGEIGEAVITRTLADSLSVKAGDTISLPTAAGVTRLTVVGLLPARTLTGSEEVWVTLPEAQKLLDQPDRINTIEANLTTSTSQDRARVEQAVKDALGRSYDIGTLATGTEILNSVTAAQVAFSLFGFFALLMGGFIIFNTFRTVVAERRHDISLLRSIGASRGTIVMLILAEGLIQGIVGTLVGMVLGYALALGLLVLARPVLSHYIHLTLGMPVMTLPLILVTAAIGIGITLLSGLIPALGASRVSPIEALRPSAVEVIDRRRMWRGAFAGAGLLVIAVLALLAGDIRVSLLGTVLFLIGMVLVAPVLLEPLAKVLSMLAAWVFAREGTGTMAEANLSRQPTRATITASATMVGLAILIALGGVATSIRGGFLDVLEKSLGSDYLLIPPAIGVWDSNVGAGNDLIERLRAAPGVETVSALWPAVSAVGESHANFALLGIDPVAYPRVAGLSFVAGSEAAAYSRLAQGRNVIANGILAAQEGLKVGDDVRLVTPTGEATYHVVAIASDYLNAKIPTAYISQANLKADFHKDESVFIQLNMTQGADPAKVRAELKRIGEDYPQFRIIAGREYYDENQQILDSSFLVFDMLIVVLAAPSLIALLNTLAVAVIERTREIGMLRASGATRRQVGRMIVAESLLLAGIGTALGLATGIYLSYVLVSAMSLGGYPVKYVFPTEGVVLAIVAGLAFGALAAIVPARQASRLQIIRALQYE